MRRRTGRISAAGTGVRESSQAGGKGGNGRGDGRQGLPAFRTPRRRVIHASIISRATDSLMKGRVPGVTPARRHPRGI
ncbi:hypothetical protein [Arthrobacter sp. NicSoilB8]|uniref:hypothetical protein n=1 Tax=Arthrobacter sp. NicSoilB8 TaxID=2830998 RepID=UPI001CC4858D|nr:hypothetical protein [Arthrobacter sp. NicSoilB8]